MTAVRNTVWTDEKVADLKKHAAAGLTSTQIAVRLKCSRNAVNAKADREKIELKGRALKKIAAPAVKPMPRNPVGNIPWAPTKPLPAARHEPPGLCTIHTLTINSCRWPIGDPQSDAFTFCGQPKARGSYCAHHGAIAFSSAPLKKLRA